jgi:hypothetical protein
LLTAHVVTSKANKETQGGCAALLCILDLFEVAKCDLKALAEKKRTSAAKS